MRGTVRRTAAWTTLVIGLLAQVLSSAPPAGAAGVASPIEYELMAMINHERVRPRPAHVPPADLGAGAWAQHLHSHREPVPRLAHPPMPRTWPRPQATTRPAT